MYYNQVILLYDYQVMLLYYNQVILLCDYQVILQYTYILVLNLRI